MTRFCVDPIDGPDSRHMSLKKSSQQWHEGIQPKFYDSPSITFKLLLLLLNSFKLSLNSTHNSTQFRDGEAFCNVMKKEKYHQNE